MLVFFLETLKVCRTVAKQDSFFTNMLSVLGLGFFLIYLLLPLAVLLYVIIL